MASYSRRYSTMKSIFFGQRCHWHCWPLVCGVNYTTDHWWSVSMTPLTKRWAVSMTPLTRVQQIRNILTGSRSTLLKIWCRIRPQSNIIPQWHGQPEMSRVNDAADLSWVVSVTLRIQQCKLCTKTQRCHWHRWTLVGGVNDTADQWWRMTKFSGAFLKRLLGRKKIFNSCSGLSTHRHDYCKMLEFANKNLFKINSP
jgi:hypothetical protein